jgi:hypothetical protein
MGEVRKTETKTWIGLAVLFALLLTAAPSEARVRHRDFKNANRDYTQQGFQLYFGFGGQGYEIEDSDYSFLDESESDGLFFIGAALGVDRGTSLYFEASGSEHSTELGNMAFGYAHVGVKYAPNTGYRHRWQPYGKASFGGVYLVEDDNSRHLHYNDHDDNGYFGPSIGFGAGTDYFLSHRTAIFGEVGLLYGKFDQIVVDGDDYDLADDAGITSGRVLFGIRFRL